MRNFSPDLGLRATVRTVLAAASGLLLLVGSAPAQAATQFDAYPSPGTRTAAPGTQISFRGGTQAELGAISVRGSRSGAHTGTLEAHSDGHGVSFEPAHPFRPGERVTVKTNRPIAGAGGSDFAFTVGDVTTRATRLAESPTIGHGAVQAYASRPDLDPPALVITTAKPGLAPGLVFLAPKGGRGQDGPMIVDNAGRLVWFKPMTGGDLAADFRVQTYQGRPVLTWWQGKLAVGDGAGQGVIYDSSYRPVATVHAGNGLSFDLHEFTITPRGTALITVYQRDKMDLRPYGGSKNARIVDSIVQEIDLKTGLVEFEWHSLGNVGLKESYAPPPTHQGEEWDYMHINSVAEDADGNLIVSGRNTWSVYKISRATGKIIWRLGGKQSSFKMGAGTAFAWQHNARPQPDGTLTLFDNGAAPPVQKKSQALTLKLDATAKTATLVTAFSHPAGLLSASQGDNQKLPNGDAFVGFGSQRYFSEFSPGGQLLFDAHLAKGNDTYRAFRFPWIGTPADAPRLAAQTAGEKVTANASWNGATGVARWQLLAGPSQEAMTAVAEVPAGGFETTLTAATAQPLVAVRALDANGATLATSAAITA
jgi:Arylsulfotransferase (ASST)